MTTQSYVERLEVRVAELETGDSRRLAAAAQLGALAMRAACAARGCMWCKEQIKIGAPPAVTP